ncbi:hypothetical protein TNIN_464431, partial [Trichonephila inaurata madagascariensis]
MKKMMTDANLLPWGKV